MPEKGYVGLDRSEILRLEESDRLAKIFVRLGVRDVKLTGGEPLVRKGIERLVARLCATQGLEDLSLTTNGSLLKDHAKPLFEAGLRRLNISLDTLDRKKFQAITARGSLERVLEGIFAAKAAGFSPIKLNAVVRKDFNADQIVPLARFGLQNGFEVRFIEFMDTGNGNGWDPSKLLDKNQILDILASAGFSLVCEGRQNINTPAVSFVTPDGSLRVGVIASVSEPFCQGCTRARLTADGRLVTCLFASKGFDLKGILRSGASDGEISAAISRIWGGRSNRYSEERLEWLRSGKDLFALKEQRLEMVRLGG
jgi:cyclic pyranopterin phosphate synthase